jgi:hypothetical protein
MAVPGLGNPLGAVVLYDFGIPKIITGKCITNISGGAFVYGSSAAGVVTSGADSFVAGDLMFLTDASGLFFNGIAMQDVASGGLVPVLLEGVLVVGCNGGVSGGCAVMVDGNNAVAVHGSGIPPGNIIGRALTAGASGTNTYAVVHIKG